MSEIILDVSDLKRSFRQGETVIEVLRGVETERIKTWHHDSLSVYGIGADRSEHEWRAILRQLAPRTRA